MGAHIGTPLVVIIGDQDCDAVRSLVTNHCIFDAFTILRNPTFTFPHHHPLSSSIDVAWSCRGQQAPLQDVDVRFCIKVIFYTLPPGFALCNRYEFPPACAYLRPQSSQTQRHDFLTHESTETRLTTPPPQLGYTIPKYVRPLPRPRPRCPFPALSISSSPPPLLPR